MARSTDEHGRLIEPVNTTEADWAGVAEALSRAGALAGETVYRVGFPRRDLAVTSKGVQIKAGFALGSYAAFARYRDGKTMVMGDLVVAEEELQRLTDALQSNGIDQTGVHKHLLAHEPPVWWCHIHAVGADPVAIARGIRAALDVTATPPPAAPAPPAPLDLDTAGIDAALGAKGSNDGGIYKFSFARAETVTSHQRVLLPAMGVSTALNFQPVGDGRAAINGDFVMTADEVQHVIQALRAGGIEIIELHNHALDDHPRLFYMHFWAVDDAVTLANALRQAVEAHNVQPAS
ncbi:DUF1259 domain-containing protein [Allokutzneria oryzae]|uniref:DUF1259 domain-containing protein n=1 Tax=Allokutzneria oryzae TaxID=1378989 RepID=A0ABV5ZYG4_9PSEU